MPQATTVGFRGTATPPCPPRLALAYRARAATSSVARRRLGLYLLPSRSEPHPLALLPLALHLEAPGSPTRLLAPASRTLRPAQVFQAILLCPLAGLSASARTTSRRPAACAILLSARSSTPASPRLAIARPRRATKAGCTPTATTAPLQRRLVVSAPAASTPRLAAPLPQAALSPSAPAQPLFLSGPPAQRLTSRPPAPAFRTRPAAICLLAGVHVSLKTTSWRRALCACSRPRTRWQAVSLSAARPTRPFSTPLGSTTSAQPAPHPPALASARAQ